MNLIPGEWAAVLQTLPLDQSGRRVVTAFVRAIEERVPAAIPPLVLESAFTAPENGVARFVNQIVGKNLKISPTLVGRQRENRASLRFFLTHPEKPDWAQAMWFLLEKVPVGTKE